MSNAPESSPPDTTPKGIHISFTPPANPAALHSVPDYRGKPAATPATAAGVTPELSPDHYRQIELAKQRSKKILRAATTSRLEGYVIAFFGVCAVLFYFASVAMDAAAGKISLATVTTGIQGLFVGVALCYVAYGSISGAKRLRKFDPSAPASLALNQFVLAAAVILYAAYSLFISLHGPSSTALELKQAGISPNDLPGFDLEGLDRLFAELVYGTLIIGTIIAQGLEALYYSSRKKIIDKYLAETPKWIVDLQRSQA